MISYPHVNLLKKNEQRYQGSVSKKMIISLATLVPFLFLLLFGGIEFVQYNSAVKSLKSNKVQWAKMQPKLKAYKKQKALLNKDKKILALINGWKKIVIPMSTVLSELQNMVPSDIQFKGLSITAQSKTTTFKKPEDFLVSYTLSINGIAEGEKGGTSVFDFQKNFLEPKPIAALFSSAKLGTMSKSQDGDKKVIHKFSITASSKKEGR